MNWLGSSDLGLRLGPAFILHLRRVAQAYLHGADAKIPLASPLYGNLHGLPPLLILVGTNEVLLDDSVRLANRARAAGAEVKLDIWPEMLHVWPLFAAFLPEGRLALVRAGQFVREKLAATVVSG
jgi:acetyl esterase/lipase